MKTKQYDTETTITLNVKLKSKCQEIIVAGFLKRLGEEYEFNLFSSLATC